MIISAASDYRAAAQRILPPFLFHYIDGGAYAEHTLRRNVEDLSDASLAPAYFAQYVGPESGNDIIQREAGDADGVGAGRAVPGCTPAAAKCRPPARRDDKGIPFTLSTVSVCPIEEVAPTIKRPMWFQLYVLRDRGLCAMRWSAPKPPAARRWSLPSICRLPAPATATPIPA